MPARGAEAGTALAGADLQLVARTSPRRLVKRYRVRPGDTPGSVAVRYHAWTAELVALNGPVLYAGDVIRIPVVPRAQRDCTRHRHHNTNLSAGAGKKSSKQKVSKQKASKQKASKKGPGKQKAGKKAGKSKAASATSHKKKAATKAAKKRRAHRAAHRHGWHHADVTRSKVRKAVARKARRQGVDPNLALAIAWQESGWQQRRISSAGAIGAMQIMPGTGRWISQIVGRRLNPRDLYHNALTGVRLIRILRAEARLKVAVAGYYQGLTGVREKGMYPSTKQYVANVLALRKRIDRGWHPD